ncbi:hypothetical protein E2C01_044921 [Portunus trituberculatus]|uniref:Uncharacterized protein n=1 Tax=Portunus trituberculatus TaxID=210409 RepID=A0A5B7G3N0_PORTR|nr:hypothetical protein [Portunus trituberculatus]
MPRNQGREIPLPGNAGGNKKWQMKVRTSREERKGQVTRPPGERQGEGPSGVRERMFDQYKGPEPACWGAYSPSQATVKPQQRIVRDISTRMC